MLKIICVNLWETIRKKAEHAEYRQAAIAYVTDPKLLPLRNGDILVTDASDASIAGGRTSAVALEGYFNSGVTLFCLANLHAKVLLLDDWAVVGSANASQHSAHVYFEAAMLTDRPEIVGQAEKLVSFLAKTGDPIDKKFIKRILKIPVTKAPGASNGAGTRKPEPPPLDPKFWLIGLRADATYPGDVDTVEEVAEKVKKKVGAESGVVDWFWWSGNARFSTEAKEGDIVIEIWRPHSEIATTRSVRVFRHGRITSIFQEPGVKAKTYHCIWPGDYEETALSWSKFVALAKQAGINRRFSYKSVIEVTEKQSSALFELWPQ